MDTRQLDFVGHALVPGLCDYDPTRLQAPGIRFSAPVFTDETIRSEIWRSGSFRARVVEGDVVVVNNGRVVAV